MTVMVTQGADGLKSENIDPNSYQISRYTANRQRKSDHSPLPVKESIATQRIENINEPLTQPQLLYRRSIASLSYPGNEQDSLAQIRNTGNGSHEMKAADVDQYRTELTLATTDELNTGGDGIARSAVIRTKNGLTSRPVTKLYPLEVPPSEADVEDSSDNGSERLCRKAKREALEKIKKLR